MITKDQLLASMLRECEISIHLFGKLTPASYTYQPAEGQRTTTELLRYLSICAIAAITSMTEKNWKRFGEYNERAKAMEPASFPEAMRLQMDELEAFFAATSEEEMRDSEAQMPWGNMVPLAVGIFDGPAKWLAAYKLQLFLYAKANGASEIGTANAWASVDRR